MRIHAVLDPDPSTVEGHARGAEEVGFDGAWITETSHDPFLASILAARETERLHVGTGIAVAFPRSPMHLAYMGHDVQTYSKGRFALGLGSQVRAHVERRFSTPWSQPVERMHELIRAVRHIWRCWNEGERLDFRGTFYQHTLMVPFFQPEPSPYGPPEIFLAAVGERMTRVAGEVADGMLVHGFSTGPYLSEVVLPALERGLAESGRSRDDVEISRQLLVATGRDEGELAEATQRVRRQIAFYASTPAYRPVLELHDRGGLQEELAGLVKAGRWDDMTAAVDDELLDAVAAVGPPEALPELVAQRCRDLDRVSFRLPYEQDPERWSSVLAELKARLDAT